MPNTTDEALEVARRIALYRAMGDYAKVAAWEAVHARLPRSARVVSDRRVADGNVSAEP